jgi:Flp pilus assembly protein TadG
MVDHIGVSHVRALRGQILVMLAIAIVVLIIFAGLTIDFGIAYTDKTALSRAVDAAALEGMRNLSQGTTLAQKLATDTFNANVQALGSYSTSPTFAFVKNTDSSGNQSVTITGTVYWQPLFLRMFLPSPVAISESATVGRAPLYMSWFSTSPIR